MSRRVNEFIIVAALCLVAASVAGCACAPRNRGVYVPAATGEPSSGQVRTILWFVGPGGEAVPVTRNLPAERARVWATIDALAAGPTADAGLSPALPRGIRLRKVVYWSADVLPAGTIDLDFAASDSRSVTTASDAIGHSLAQFPDVTAARILVDGVPAGPSGSDATATLKPAETRTVMQYVPLKAGSRLYLAARHVTDAPALSDFDAVAARLLDSPYIRAILPRGSKVCWNATSEADGCAVAVTIELRRKKFSDQDWATVQLAADAVALTLKTIPGTKTVTVAVAGQSRTFAYPGSVWPNPEPD